MEVTPSRWTSRPHYRAVPTPAAGDTGRITRPRAEAGPRRAGPDSPALILSLESIITLLTLVVALFVSLVIQVPFELIGYGSVSDLAGGGGDVLSARTLIASSLGSIVAATLVDPFTAGVRALLYVDRRMRAEGLDVALTAAAAHPSP